MRTFARFALLLALGLAPAGCGKDNKPRPPAGAAPATGVRVGRQAPEIAGVDEEGRPLRLSDYRGKVVVLDFWATW